MNKVSMILSVLMTLALVVILAPNIFAANRGKVLRNIAIWLAIFAGLGLIYQNFGPESAHPLFAQPEAFTNGRVIPPPGGKNDEKKPDDWNADGAQGYTPPKE